MRRKVKALEFIPQAINFSDIDVNEDEVFGHYEEQTFFETQILQMIYSLDSDKERCVLMLQLLRGYGLNVDHESSAKSLGVNWRWYMRIKAKVQKKLSKFNI